MLVSAGAFARVDVTSAHCGGSPRSRWSPGAGHGGCAALLPGRRWLVSSLLWVLMGWTSQGHDQVVSRRPA